MQRDNVVLVDFGGPDKPTPPPGFVPPTEEEMLRALTETVDRDGTLMDFTDRLHRMSGGAEHAS